MKARYVILLKLSPLLLEPLVIKKKRQSTSYSFLTHEPYHLDQVFLTLVEKD